MESIQVLDPTNEAISTELSRCERQNTLEGKVLGVVDNGKPNSDIVVKTISQKLKEEYQLRDVIYFRKPSSSHQIPHDEAEKLAKQCDAVITGTGD